MNNVMYPEINGIVPTPHQIEVLDNIVVFLNMSCYTKENAYLARLTPEQATPFKLKELNDTRAYQFGTLQGKAGVGKTTVAQWIAIAASKISASVCIAYPTHKAGRVIRDKIEGNYKFSTIQALIGMKPHITLDRFNPNRPNFTYGRADHLPMDDYKVIIMDEGSMLAAAVYLYVIKRAKRMGIKILFIGHKAQLPGINERLSKVFTDVANTFYLNEVIRQKTTNPNTEPLAKLEEDILLEMAACNSITSTSGGHTFDQNKYEALCKLEGVSKDNVTKITDFSQMFSNTWKTHLQSNPSMINHETGEGYKCMSYSVYADTLAEIYVSPEYNKDRNTLQMYSYTNNEVGKANHNIRDSRNPDGVNNILAEGETIMAYQNIKGNGDEILLTNSEDFIIKSITEIETRWRYDGNASLFENDGINDRSKPVLQECSASEPAHVVLKAYKCQVTPVNISKNDERDFDSDFIYIAHPDSYKAMVEEHYKYFKLSFGFVSKAVKSKYPLYLNFKAKNVLINNLYCNPHTNEVNVKYNHGDLKPMNKDIDRGYACTIHKSQGSTKEFVGINLQDILKNEMISLSKCPQGNDIKSVKARLDNSIYFKKLLYVAWSRTSKFAFICVKS